MAGRIPVANILQNHELRLRELEGASILDNESKSGEEQSEVTSPTGGKLLEVTTRLEQVNNNYVKGIDELRSTITKQQTEIASLRDLLILVQREFLRFKQDIEERERIHMVIEDTVSDVIEQSVSDTVDETIEDNQEE